MRKITVMLVDDSQVFCDGMRGLLSTEPDIEVVGEAHDGETALIMAENLQPDVIVMDLGLGENRMNGIQTTEQIVRMSPSISVLVLTISNDSSSVFAALRAGALGYVLKDAKPENIVNAIRSVSNKDALFGPSVAKRILEYFKKTLLSDYLPELDCFSILTNREREILGLVANGMTNAAIVESLTLSDKTVRNYLSNIYAKLQVNGRIEAILKVRGTLKH